MRLFHRACLKTPCRVEQATGLFRRATSPQGFSAASWRRKRAGTPCHPLFRQALRLCFALALSISGFTAFAGPVEPIQNVLLDDRVVYTVPVSTNRVTTISFPGPIAAIDAVSVTSDLKVPGLFQLAHTKGSSFFSVRALSRKVATNLNIRWNKRTYVFELIESEAAVLSLILEEKLGVDSPQPA